MNAIRKFEITGRTLSGFKCFANTTELTFGNPTLIFGGNGRGKSSVADAIAFAITGLPFFGERGIDRLHAEQNNDLFISMRFTDENGAEHELTRTRQKTRMTITLDGREIRQVDLTDLFGEKDVFLSIFNPLYFIEELGDDGKKLLERYLPEITQEEVLAQLSESAQETLRGEKILSPESFLKKKREDIRELEKSKIYLSGQKDLSESQYRQAEEKRSALEETLRELEAECTELESRRYAGMDVADVQERLVELSARYEELAKEVPASADTSEIDRELAELNRKLGERSAEQYAPKYAQPIAELTAKVKELGGRYQREAATLKGGTWSVCLVDTRTAAGVPAGAENGVPKRVNRWCAVEGGVKVADASAQSVGSTGKPAARGVGGGVRATTLSEVPASTPSPVITAMEVADGVAAFAVADTVSYLTYTVESSEELGGFSTDKYADKVDGAPGAEIVLATDAPSDCRFFRITRAE